jgi:hypothetical protein
MNYNVDFLLNVTKKNTYAQINLVKLMLIVAHLPSLVPVDMLNVTITLVNKTVRKLLIHNLPVLSKFKNLEEEFYLLILLNKFTLEVVKLVKSFVLVENVHLLSSCALLLKLVLRIWLDVQIYHVKNTNINVLLKLVNLVNSIAGMVNVLIIHLNVQQEFLALKNTQFFVLKELV